MKSMANLVHKRLSAYPAVNQLRAAAEIPRTPPALVPSRLSIVAVLDLVPSWSATIAGEKWPLPQ